MYRKSAQSYILLSLLVFWLFAPLLAARLVATYKNRIAQLHFSANPHPFFLNPIVPLTSLPVKTADGMPLDSRP